MFLVQEGGKDSHWNLLQCFLCNITITDNRGLPGYTCLLQQLTNSNKKSSFIVKKKNYGNMLQLEALMQALEMIGSRISVKRVYGDG